MGIYLLCDPTVSSAPAFPVPVECAGAGCRFQGHFDFVVRPRPVGAPRLGGTSAVSAPPSHPSTLQATPDPGARPGRALGCHSGGTRMTTAPTDTSASHTAARRRGLPGRGLRVVAWLNFIGNVVIIATGGAV